MSRLEALLESGTAIAVVGMAGRFPGARNARTFWQNSRSGMESIRRLSDQELAARGVPRSILADPAYVKAAAVLEGMDHFDAGFFGFSPRDAAILDPQHRHFLEVAWEALEDAGHVPERFEGPVGVFAGSGANAYFWANLMTNPELVREVGFFLLRHTGNDKDFLSTRVSYSFDLTGPSVNVQTACSTSLVSVHLATQSLLLGECDMALAGGVTIEQPHAVGYMHKEGEILSPDGHCRPFDASASGTVFGSGVGVVVLRRLQDAIADGDHVRAILLGSAINNDGSLKVGYLAPSVDGQAKAIAEAIGVAGVDPASIGYIEAHGTGTAVGDPIEVAALAQAFRNSDGTPPIPASCALGSVKGNIGHADTAAGVAGLIRAIGALEARELPPTLHYESPNPALDLDGTPFFVPGAPRAWEARGPRRAGVSSLGVGGTNAFVVLEEAPVLAYAPPPRRLHLLPFSGRSERVREAAGADLAGFLEDANLDGPALADAAWTLSTGRRRFRYRRAVLAGSAAEAAEALAGGDTTRVLTGEAPDDPPGVAFLFAGGGAQHPAMGAGLYREEARYREVVDSCLDWLDPDLRTRVRLLLLEPDATEDAERPCAALPALFITQLAQARLWESWGVRPAAMIGHSMGEYTAACLAGVMEPGDALRIVVARGRLLESLPPGGMLSVPLGEAELLPLLPDGVSLAAVNGPELTVASGPLHLLAELEARLAEGGVEGRRVRISVAAHSAMLEPILQPFEAELRTVPFSAPRIPFASNLTGDWITETEACDPGYWVRQLRHTVRFADGIRRLVHDEPRVLLEIGPGRTLATLARGTFSDRSVPGILTSMRSPSEASERTEDDLEVQLAALARLWTLGVEPDWRAFFGEGKRLRMPLPTYPFEHERYFIEPGNGVPLRLSDGGAAGAYASVPEEASSALRSNAAAAGSSSDPLDGWFWEQTWEPAPLQVGSPDEPGAPGVEPSVAPGPLFLLGGEPPFEAALAEALAALGIPTTPIAPCELAARLAQLREEGTGPAAVVYLGLLPSFPPCHAGSEQEAHAMEAAFLGPLAIVQALGEEDTGADVPFLIPVTRMEAVRSGDRIEPWKALVLGPVRTAPRELPGICPRAIDLLPERAADSRALAILLAGELRAPTSDPLVAYRDGQRLRQRFRRLAVPASQRTDLDATGADGAWLVTGGLGGLGLAFARGLADRGVQHIVLLSRSGLPPRHRWEDWLAIHPAHDRTSRAIDAVLALEGAGGTIEIAAVDVTDVDALRAWRDNRPGGFPPLRGVLHAAGILDDEPILARTPERSRRVLAPKVRGTLALVEALRDEPLEHLVLCSSRSAISGVPGQVDYTAANAFLDAWARAAAADWSGVTAFGDKSSGVPPSLTSVPRVVAVEWDAWTETGMAHDLAAGVHAAPPRGELPDGATDTLGYLDHPFFSHRLSGAEGAAWYLARFAQGRHWMLDEHRLDGGSPLIPGAGFLELVRGAFELHGHVGPMALRDVLFLEPFLVPLGATRELAVRIRPAARGHEFAVLGRSVPGRDRGTEAVTPWVTHVTGLATPATLSGQEGTDGPRPMPSTEGAPLRRPTGSGLALGPRWENLSALEQQGTEAFLRLELPEPFHDDLRTHPLHPALLDVATAGAQELIPGFDPEAAFYVPASYGRFEFHRPLSPVLFSHVRYRGEAIEGMATFDIRLTDADGALLAEAEEFVMMRVDARDRLGRESESGASFPEPTAPVPSGSGEAPSSPGTRDGIDTSSGLRALERILDTPSLPPVVAVVPRDLEALLAELDRVEGASGGVGGTGSESSPEVSALVEALRSHPAVADAEAIAHSWGAGKIRVVAIVAYAPSVRATVSELRRHVRQATPDGLVPQSFVEVPEIPRDSRGRLDRSRVEDPFAPRTTHVPPRTPTERVIAGIWARLLGLERVGLHDNFLDVGGHSLVGIRVLVQVERDTGVRLHPNTLTLQTLEQIAAECDRQGARTAVNGRGASDGRDGDAGTTHPGVTGPDQPDASRDSTGLAGRLLSAVRQTVTRLEG